MNYWSMVRPNSMPRFPSMPAPQVGPGMGSMAPPNFQGSSTTERQGGGEDWMQNLARLYKGYSMMDKAGMIPNFSTMFSQGVGASTLPSGALSTSVPDILSGMGAASAAGGGGAATGGGAAGAAIAPSALGAGELGTALGAGAGAGAAAGGGLGAGAGAGLGAGAGAGLGAGAGAGLGAGAGAAAGAGLGTATGVAAGTIGTAAGGTAAAEGAAALLALLAMA